MVRYEKLPKNTPRSTRIGLVLCGLGLGLALFIQGFIALYGFVGLFSLYFYPTSSLVLNSTDIFILGVIALSATVATTMLGFLAYYMNKLSKKALPLSRIVWIPMIISVIIVLWQRTGSQFSYHLSWMWVWMGYEAIILGGILPAIFLQTKGARKLHSR